MIGIRNVKIMKRFFPNIFSGIKIMQVGAQMEFQKKMQII